MYEITRFDGLKQDGVLVATNNIDNVLKSIENRKGFEISGYFDTVYDEHESADFRVSSIRAFNVDIAALLPIEFYNDNLCEYIDEAELSTVNRWINNENIDEVLKEIQELIPSRIKTLSEDLNVYENAPIYEEEQIDWLTDNIQSLNRLSKEISEGYWQEILYFNNKDKYGKIIKNGNDLLSCLPDAFKCDAKDKDALVNILKEMPDNYKWENLSTTIKLGIIESTDFEKLSRTNTFAEEFKQKFWHHFDNKTINNLNKERFQHQEETNTNISGSKKYMTYDEIVSKMATYMPEIINSNQLPVQFIVEMSDVLKTHYVPDRFMQELFPYITHNQKLFEAVAEHAYIYDNLGLSAMRVALVNNNLDVLKKFHDRNLLERYFSDCMKKTDKSPIELAKSALINRHLWIIDYMKNKSYIKDEEILNLKESLKAQIANRFMSQHRETRPHNDYEHYM